MTHNRLLLIYLILLCDCGKGEQIYEIPEARVVSKSSLPLKLDITSAERFGINRLPGESQTQTSVGTKSPFSWEIPEGWEVVAGKTSRLVNLRVAGRSDVECFLT